VQGIVGGVEIEDDLLRRTGMRLQEQIDQQPFDRRRIMADLVIARWLRPAQLQPVQRRFAGDRRAAPAPGRQFAGQHRQHRVVTQRVVVDQVFVAERQAEHPLPHQGADLMLDQLRGTAIPEAQSEPVDQPDRPIRRSQQQRPGIRRDRPAIERGHHRTPFHGCKSKQI